MNKPEEIHQGDPTGEPALTPAEQEQWKKDEKRNPDPLPATQDPRFPSMPTESDKSPEVPREPPYVPEEPPIITQQEGLREPPDDRPAEVDPNPGRPQAQEPKSNI